jgi:hypothetical protein
MLFNLNAFALSGRDYLIAYAIPGRCPGLIAHCPFGALIHVMPYYKYKYVQR